MEISVSEVARRAEVLPAVAHREVSRLIEAGVLKDRRDGNNRLVSANTQHPLWSLMSQLVAETYGPVPVLRDLLREIPGVDQAFIYGSWAVRRSGTAGPPPRDVDVLVVGQPSRGDVLDVAEVAGQRLRTEVNIHLVSREAWDARSDPFLKTVADRPLIALTSTESTLARDRRSDQAT
ncbi:winged helix-turn-helix domain-containing protein [Myceligenerans crystallogenes]|uniref:winged helix-turn-helix domain-containing protein n=1 Tax=Myceligenerans crystallogenes TaxID=316335 RepID=UPI0031DFAACE